MPKKFRYHLDNDVNGITVERAILTYIKNGAYPHVAAEASGIPISVFDQWMANGLRPTKSMKRYRDFRDKVIQAQAQARVKAEMTLFADNPKLWLKSGPGKEQPDRPGWTSEMKPLLENKTQINVLANPEWNGLWSIILKSLAEFPEARAALVDAMQTLDSSTS